MFETVRDLFPDVSQIVNYNFPPGLIFKLSNTYLKTKINESEAKIVKEVKISIFGC